MISGTASGRFRLEVAGGPKACVRVSKGRRSGLRSSALSSPAPPYSGGPSRRRAVPTLNRSRIIARSNSVNTPSIWNRAFAEEGVGRGLVDLYRGPARTLRPVA